MKSAAKYLRVFAVFVLASSGAITLTFEHARAQNASGQPVIPLRPIGPLSSVSTPVIPGLDGIVANRQAAITLGKALFWDMQVGSDNIQACATCHFNAGADSRTINQLSPGIKAGDNTFQIGNHVGNFIGPNYQLHAGTPGAGFGGYHDGDYPFHKVADVNSPLTVVSDTNDVTSSEGIFNSSLRSMIVTGRGQGSPSGTNATEVDQVTPDPVFSYPDPNDPTKLINTRRAEPRNTPSVVNAVFNFRNFWDGRAQNSCNGANPFGPRDTASHFFIAESAGAPLISTMILLQNASLCSQALGPALSVFEMSAANRDFKQLGSKMLSLPALGKQLVDPTDSVLGSLSNSPKPGLNTSYVAMVQKTFRPEWWQSPIDICIAADGGETFADTSKGASCPAGANEYSQMEYNFSLFWALAVQAYESTLVSDQTPLDQYLAGQQTLQIVGDGTKNFYSLTLAPNVDPRTVSIVELNPNLDASDQDIFAFDDGNGQISGVGVLSGTINYKTGILNMLFETPPVTAFPVKISFSTGPVPLTQAQLYGLNLFQVKGRCVACHGGPELSNAASATVSAEPLERMVMGDFNIRVYDTGFYNGGARPAKEDISLGDVDGVIGMPLSHAETMRQRVCNQPGLNLMIPGRPGDGLTSAPLSCSDDIARKGFFKVPQLRNVALTAPYFHNGGQLTLEQVVEFYNRGGDFISSDPEQLPYLDPNVVPLGLTLQEKTDLVDFLRNALTDPRTVAQSAPFDHPQIFVPNGHIVDANGYPVVTDPNHPGQAAEQYMTVPPVGANGGAPLPTFLQNLKSP